jgi:tetratricopeptide (TPR) repeat protein
VTAPLKRISAEGIPAALDKAERYRLLNDPEQAESICRDILVVDLANQDAVRTLVLALTDQFGTGYGHGGVAEARKYVEQLHDAYERAYFTGIVFEREARAFLDRSLVAHAAAYDGFQEAMEWYEKAEALRPHGNDDALLRYNSCLRTIDREKLTPQPEPPEQPLE